MSIPTQAPIARMVEQHHGLERSLPLSDVQDFADATRGLIATLDPALPGLVRRQPGAPVAAPTRRGGYPLRRVHGRGGRRRGEGPRVL
jgi:hypothetical protein